MDIKSPHRTPLNLTSSQILFGGIETKITSAIFNQKKPKKVMKLLVLLGVAGCMVLTRAQVSCSLLFDNQLLIFAFFNFFPSPSLTILPCTTVSTILEIPSSTALTCCETSVALPV